MNLEIATAFFQAAGHVVSQAEDGADAVLQAGTADFDVVLMDVRMPGMDGLEATRRIRALSGLRGRVPVIGLTAQSLATEVAACYDAGMTGFIGKPFKPEELVSAVENAASAAALNVDDDSPLIDLKIYDEHFGRLSSKLCENVQISLAARIRALQSALFGPDYGNPTARDIAHTVIGAAGLVGLARLSAAAKAFDNAGLSGPGDISPAADRLKSTIDATVTALRRSDYVDTFATLRRELETAIS